MKNAERLPGVSEILLPSERGNRVAQQRISSGMVPIEPNLYHNLKVMASKADAGTGRAAAAAGPAGGMKLEVGGGMEAAAALPYGVAGMYCRCCQHPWSVSFLAHLALLTGWLPDLT